MTKPDLFKNAPNVQDVEVLVSKKDEGSGRDLPVTLVTYDDGRMDLHRQTGTQFAEHIQEAKEILAARGFTVAAPDSMLWPSGVYMAVSPAAA